MSSLLALLLSSQQSLKETIFHLATKVNVAVHLCEVLCDHVFQDLLRATKKRTFDPFKRQQYPAAPAKLQVNNGLV